ncbi:PREDICTED: gelsolin-like [Papilio xuthus]|uniref:Gelsolin-like n=1 Tax=Papilio xuthus TaxID=66420 RepID=A0AAJ6ZTV0_PAPXU|nr:PREDICTED: gelsolin-like [Papilio xuthus]
MKSLSIWALLALFVCVQSRTTHVQQPITAQITSLTDKDARRKASVHAAFSNAGRQAGVEVWRIVDFNPVAVAQNDIGKFNKGDSYIVLKTTADKKNNLSWDIYYWIGSESTQDESGAAAILTVGLDDKFNGAAIQHRETLGHESQQFLSLFRPAIRYIDGGAASGFNHVVTNPGAEKRLFHIKGKKNIRVRQVDPLIASMNKGDCFVLDIDNDIYVYVGDSANHKERLKAISFANQVRDQDHNGRGKVDIVDQYSSDTDVQKYFTALGSGTRDIVPEASAGGDDQTFERSEEDAVILSEISDSKGSLVATPLRKPFRQENLKPQEAYILDTVSGSIYVWLGRQATKREKTEAMSKAQQLLRCKNYPSWVQVTRIPQGTEPAAFKQYFATWQDVGMSHSRLVRSADTKTTTMSENWIQPKLYKGIVKSETLMLFEEIPNFKQTDLSQDSVFVLDMGDELFVWVGEDVSELERKVTFNIHAHLVPLKSKFSKNWYVIMTKQGLEPESFKKSFGKWQPELLQKLRNSDDEEKYDALNFNEIDD